MVYAIHEAGPVLVASTQSLGPPALLGLGSGAFDFRGAGPDWLSLQRSSMTLFHGVGPESLVELPYSTSLGGVFPIVADIDNNGSADVLLRGTTGSSNHWVAAYEDTKKRPSPARRIWNQWNYTASSVREDARLPPAATPRGDAFRVQTRLSCKPILPTE